MDVKEAIDKRRSIRKFEDRALSHELVDEILEAGRLAPSGTNVQPTRVFIISSNDARKKLQKAGAFAQEFVHKAPLILVVCGKPDDYGDEGEPMLKGKNRDRCMRDLTIASSFMVLRATELGIATCWIGLVNPGAIKGVLGIAEDYIIPYVLCVGYPSEKPAPRRRKPLEELILGKA